MARLASAACLVGVWISANRANFVWVGASRHRFCTPFLQHGKNAARHIGRLSAASENQDSAAGQRVCILGIGFSYYRADPQNTRRKESLVNPLAVIQRLGCAVK